MGNWKVIIAGECPDVLIILFVHHFVLQSVTTDKIVYILMIMIM